ncbi:MAG: alpha/beta hydrolase [Mycobacteriaceae bacterium]
MHSRVIRGQSFKLLKRIYAPLCVILLTVTGCSQVVSGTALPKTVVPAGLDVFYQQEIHWGGCEDYLKSETSASYDQKLSECATVMVPIDYRNPGGQTARIAVFRLKATGNKLGSLLLNPGGPGQSGVAFAADIGQSLAKQEIGERYDIVGFDPRGIGASTPKIVCETGPEKDQNRRESGLDRSPAGIAALEQQSKDFIAGCSARVGNAFLAHIGVVDVARDMDVIRAVLGDSKLTYLGYSYGTRIGAAYAEQFPLNVHAMVLDGAVDPSQDPIESNILQGTGFQKAFDDFAAYCAQDDGCPLGDDLSTATKKYRGLLDPLIDAPARTEDPRGLSYADAQTGTILALYSSSIWGKLKAGLQELEQARGDTLLSLADIYHGRAADGSYDNTSDAFTAVRCVDDPPLVDRQLTQDLDVRYRAAAPFLDPGVPSEAAPLDVCAFWPVPHTSAPHPLFTPGLPAVVVVSTTRDPATPYEAGVDLAKALEASLITYEGTQHTVVFQGNSCVDEVITRYLVDARKPVRDLRC